MRRLQANLLPNVLQHTMRRSKEIGLSVDDSAHFAISGGPACACRAAIICAVAFEKNGSKARIQKWLELTDTARKGLEKLNKAEREELLPNDEKIGFEKAGVLAAHAAKALKLQIRSRSIHAIFEFLFDVGIGVLTSMYGGLYAGAVAGGVAQRTGFSRGCHKSSTRDGGSFSEVRSTSFACREGLERRAI